MPPLPDRPLFEAETLDPSALTGLDAETRQFVLDMHATGGGVINLGDEARRLCDAAVAETETYFTDQGAGRVADAWRRKPAVRKLALVPKLHAALAAAYGRRSFAFQTINFRQGSQQELHSDTIHFHCLPERFMCGVWIALEDIAPGSGPLVYYPGSHRLPVLAMPDVGVNTPTPGHQDYLAHYAPRFAERIEASGLPRRELILPKGWAFVWAANLAHGGAPIERPGSTRRSQVAHCYFEDSLYFTPMLSDLAAGRRKLRLPIDLATRRWRWPRLNGSPARLPLSTVAAAALRELSNRLNVYR